MNSDEQKKGSKMQDTAPKLEKQKLPTVPGHDFADVVLQIKKDPNCHRAGCYGRGYVGVNFDPETKEEALLLCKCASFEENSYTRVLKHLQSIEKACIVLIAKEDQVIAQNKLIISYLENLPIAGKISKRRTEKKAKLEKISHTQLDIGAEKK